MPGTTNAKISGVVTTPISFPSSPASTTSSSSLSTPNESVDASEMTSMKKELKQTKAQLDKLQLQSKSHEKENDFYRMSEMRGKKNEISEMSNERTRELEAELKATVRSLAKVQAELTKSEEVREENNLLRKQIAKLRDAVECMHRDKEPKVAELEALRASTSMVGGEAHLDKQWQQEKELRTVPSNHVEDKYNDEVKAVAPREISVQPFGIENSETKQEIEKLREQVEKSHIDMRRTLQGQHEAELQLENVLHQIATMADDLAEVRSEESVKFIGREMDNSPSSFSVKDAESGISRLRKKIEDLKVENKCLKFSSGQKELISSLISDLKSEIATLKEENESLKRTISSCSSEKTSSSFEEHNLITSNKDVNDNGEQEFRIVIANLEQQKEYLEVSMRDLQTSLVEKERSLAISLEHASMLEQVISQLERTHMHVDKDSKQVDLHPADFSTIRNDVKIAVYHANYLGAMCNKRGERADENKAGDDIVHSLIDNIDVLDADIQRLEEKWISREMRVSQQDELIQALKNKIDQRSTRSSPIDSMGANSPLSPYSLKGDQHTPQTAQPSLIYPPSPSVPPSPSIKLLMEIHQQLDLELQDCCHTSPTLFQRNTDFSDSNVDNSDIDERFSPLDSRKNVSIIEASKHGETDRYMAELLGTIENLKASNLEKDILIAERDAQIEEFTSEITKLESEKRQLGEKFSDEKPFNSLIQKVDKINADWIETEDQSKLLIDLTDRIYGLEAQIESKDKLLVEIGEKMGTLRRQAEFYEFQIFDLIEDKLVLEIESHNLRYFPDMVNNLANNQQVEKIDMVVAREERDRLQTQLAIHRESKIRESEKKSVFSLFCEDSIFSSKAGPKSNPQNSNSELLPPTNSDRKKNRSKTSRRALTAEEAAIQIVARNNSRTALKLHNNSGNVNEKEVTHENGVVLKATPRDLRERRSEKDCNAAMGCTPS